MSVDNPSRTEVPSEERRAAMLRIRARMLPIIKDMGYETFTCDGCAHAPACPYVYDLYNTGGDCLADQ